MLGLMVLSSASPSPAPGLEQVRSAVSKSNVGFHRDRKAALCFSVYFSPEWGMGKGQIGVKGLWGKALRGHGCGPSVACRHGDTWAACGPYGSRLWAVWEPSVGCCTRGRPGGAPRAAPEVATTERDTRRAAMCDTGAAHFTRHAGRG